MAIPNNKWIEKLELILEDYIGNSQIDNEFIANQMGISKRQFYRKVKAETGTSPNQYIRQYKLQKAMEMLRSGNFHTVQEISLKLGFQNQHYFSIAFEKEYGERPLKVLRRLGFR